MNNVNEFFKAAGQTRNKQVVCADGFSMSVQAHAGAYCKPRGNNEPKYTHVEIGFPSEREPMLMEWCEDSEDPTGVGGGNIGTGNVPQPGEASFSSPDTGPTGTTE